MKKIMFALAVLLLGLTVTNVAEAARRSGPRPMTKNRTVRKAPRTNKRSPVKKTKAVANQSQRAPRKAAVPQSFVTKRVLRFNATAPQGATPVARAAPAARKNTAAVGRKPVTSAVAGKQTTGMAGGKAMPTKGRGNSFLATNPSQGNPDPLAGLVPMGGSPIPGTAPSGVGTGVQIGSVGNIPVYQIPGLSSNWAGVMGRPQ